MLAEVQCILCGKDFNSHPEAFLCNICQEQEKNYHPVVPLQNKHSVSFPCPKCTYKNSSDSIQCEVCQHIFEQKLHKVDPIKSEPKELITCKKCKFDNHITNEYCLNCEQDLFEHAKKTCGICGLKVKEDNFNKHESDCIMSLSMIEQEQEAKILMEKKQPIPEYHHFPDVKPIEVKPIRLRPFQGKPLVQAPKKPMKPHPKSGGFRQKSGLFKQAVGFFGFGGQSTTMSCYYCYKKISRAQFAFHTENCQRKEEWSRNIEPALSRMTPLQAKAIQYMHKKSMKEHETTRKQLEQKVYKLGYSSEDLENLSYYIENYAPIIIQIHVSKHMEFFVKDTHYRNQFETNKSSGSLSRASRTTWEDRMFDKYYSQASDFERVKYGVINFTNDPKGVNCAKSYGPSYFLLKSHVRDRCTFTDKDSSSADASIATLKFGFKIISKMNDNELKAAFSASKALQMSSSVIVTYKQLQIHGPIEFSKDIERVYVNKAEINGNKKLLDLVYEFSQKFKVQHDFI